VRKEGTGKPQNPDIALDAKVRMRELRFERAPEPKVCFRGNTRRNSVWGSERENLPDEVQEGVIYRDAGIRSRIATEIVDSDPEVGNSLDKERVKTSLEYWGQKAREEETESREEKK
jgi:hypothetical protein